MMCSVKSLVKLLTCCYLILGFSLHANNCLCWWDDVYLGLDGGFTTGLGKAKNSKGVGRGDVPLNGNGMSSNAILLPGWNVSAEIGYFICSWLRAEACYTFFRSNYNWDTVFGDNSGTFATTSYFESDVNIHTALINAYLHLDRLFCCCNSGCVSPYIFGGLGAAWNDLHNIKEFQSPLTGPFFLAAEYHQKTHSNFSGRFGIGLLVDLICGLQLDASIHATYVGTIETGNSAVIGGVDLEVLPHTFKNNWLGSFDIGLNYLF